MRSMIIDGKYNLGLQYESNPYSDCDCLRLGLVNRLIANGTRQIWVQCKDCNRLLRNIKVIIADSAVKAGCVIREYDNRAQEEAEERQRKKTQEYYNSVEEKNNQWWDNYNNHLKSEKWFRSRNLILERDRYTCQGCLLNRATQVHHLSYQHITSEFMFELVSVCDDCHNLLHIEGNKYGR